MPRPSWDTYFMSLAQAASTRSTCSRLQVGAILVRDFEVVGTGYNGAPRGVEHCNHRLDLVSCEISVHAEVNALIHARYRGNFPDDTLYVTHAPCFECSKLILNTPTQKVVFGEYYKTTQGVDLLADHGVLVVQFEALTETLEMGL